MSQAAIVCDDSGCRFIQALASVRYCSFGLGTDAVTAQLSEGAVGSRRRRWKPSRRVVAGIIGAALVVGAFLAWGPIGLGNGPLSAAVYATVGGTDAALRPVGFVIAIRNSGSAPAVIDAVDVIAGTRYAGPHVVALRILTRSDCGGAWPARRTPRGFQLTGCGGPTTGPLIGHAVAATRPESMAFPGAAIAGGPEPGGCWVMTEIVLHYHVGIRHYSATDPYELAVCSNHRLVDAAMNASEAAG